MNVSTYFCGACTTGGIAGLGSCSDAKDAMLTFCGTVLGENRYYSGGSAKFETFYAFTAGPEVAGHGHSKRWVRYGTEFAEFISENNLGPVTTLGAYLNLKYHPNTTCQTWLWHPDEKKLTEWYAKNAKKSGVASKTPGISMETLCNHCGYSYGKHNGWTCPSGLGSWPEANRGPLV